MDISPSESQNEATEQSGIGPTAGIVIVVILFALGGIYFLITQNMKLHAAPPPGQEQSNS